MPKISKAEEKSISDWFIHEFWPVYPSDYTRSGKGSRQKALISMIKIAPDETERRRILGNLKAQIKADKGKPDRVYWSIGVTYVNNHMWEDAIETNEEKIINQLPTCSKCNQLVHGPKYSECTNCLGKRTDALPGEHRFQRRRKQTLIDLNLYSPGQSASEVIHQCKARGLENGIYSIARTLRNSLPNLIVGAD